MKNNKTKKQTKRMIALLGALAIATPILSGVMPTNYVSQYNNSNKVKALTSDEWDAKLGLKITTGQAYISGGTHYTASIVDSNLNKTTMLDSMTTMQVVSKQYVDSFKILYPATTDAHVYILGSTFFRDGSVAATLIRYDRATGTATKLTIPTSVPNASLKFIPSYTSFDFKRDGANIYGNNINGGMMLFSDSSDNINILTGKGTNSACIATVNGVKYIVEYDKDGNVVSLTNYDTNAVVDMSTLPQSDKDEINHIVARQIVDMAAFQSQLAEMKDKLASGNYTLTDIAKYESQLALMTKAMTAMTPEEIALIKTDVETLTPKVADAKSILIKKLKDDANTMLQEINGGTLSPTELIERQTLVPTKFEAQYVNMPKADSDELKPIVDNIKAALISNIKNCVSTFHSMLDGFQAELSTNDLIAKDRLLKIKTDVNMIKSNLTYLAPADATDLGKKVDTVSALLYNKLQLLENYEYIYPAKPTIELFNDKVLISDKTSVKKESIVEKVEKFESSTLSDFYVSEGSFIVSDEKATATNTKSLRSNPIDHNKFTEQKITFTVPDDAISSVSPSLNFDYLISSESLDRALITLDGTTLVNNIGGEVNWTNINKPIAKGKHTLTVRYTKNASVSSGLDGVFIDNLNVKYTVAGQVIPKIEFKVNDTDWMTYEGMIDINPNKTTVIKARTVNNLGYYSEVVERTILPTVGEDRFNKVADSVVKAETTKDIEDISNARKEVNTLPEGPDKQGLQDRLNKIVVDDKTLNKETTSGVLDVVINSDATLELSLNTNLVEFKGFNGLEDMEKLNSVGLTVNSSTDYSVSATLISELIGPSGEKLPAENLFIKDSASSSYVNFTSDVAQKIISKATKGSNKTHSIDLKLGKRTDLTPGTYKGAIRFDATAE